MISIVGSSLYSVFYSCEEAFRRYVWHISEWVLGIWFEKARDCSMLISWVFQGNQIEIYMAENYTH